MNLSLKCTQGLGLALMAAFALLVTNPASAQANAVSVYITDNGEQRRLDFVQPPRLLQVYQAAEQANLLPATPYWPSSRLVSTSKQERVNQRQQALVSELQALAQHWQAEQPQLAETAITVANQVAEWPLIGAEFVGRLDTAVAGVRQSGIDTVKPVLYASLEQARLSERTSLNNNPQLPLDGYRLMVSPSHAEGKAPNWYVAGAVEQVIEAPYIANWSVREFAKKVRLDEFNLQGAAKSHLWQINLAGGVKQVPIAYFNASGDIAVVGGVWVLGFAPEHLPEQFKNINQQLAELARYWNVAL